ncbi:MAG: hypothetical protein RMK60_02660 [Burkholderiales bacterium]|nr:hypothetical protein [Burkholderiales bacterium]
MTTLYQRLVHTRYLPWRMRHPVQTWVETTLSAHWPQLYRRLRLGRWAAPITALTYGPKHHFFGYYDKSPWNASGSLILAHEATFNDRPPEAEDTVGIGVVPRPGDFVALTRSQAWNWQQGSMLQWHPTESEHRFVFNDRRNGTLVGVLYDLRSGEVAEYPRPIYALSPHGRWGYSLNFARLANHRPGYGYAGAIDPWADDPHPQDDGLWRIDLNSGAVELLVSLQALAQRNPKPSMRGAWHYLNHIQCAPTGGRVAFFHLWHRDPQRWEVRLYTCRTDGSELTCLLDTGFVSHYDWRNDDSLLVWARPPHGPARFLLLAHDGRYAHPLPQGGSYETFAADRLTEDGHCSFSPDGCWVLNDTYPDQYGLRTLMLVRVADRQRFDIARLYSPKSRWWGEIRCDLHPRWSRDGKAVCIDSVHTGSRQMYVLDIGPLLT